MSYRNIVFVKLEKRLLNDYRWFTMSEPAQLLYIKLILMAAETYNKIPKNDIVLRSALRCTLEPSEFLKCLEEIKSNFPKLKENKHFMYFDEFESKTNFRTKEDYTRESLRTPQGLPECSVDKEEDKDKDKEEDKESANAFFSYYLLKTKKAFRLTKDKETLIRSRLREGFTLDQMKAAVDNFVNDPWEGRKDHLDLIYCIGKQKGKPDNLEKWINFKPIKELQPQRRQL
jgi:uncharacterized phage protein (TIGR02220 family)